MSCLVVIAISPALGFEFAVVMPSPASGQVVECRRSVGKTVFLLMAGHLRSAIVGDYTLLRQDIWLCTKQSSLAVEVKAAGSLRFCSNVLRAGGISRL